MGNVRVCPCNLEHPLLRVVGRFPSLKNLVRPFYLKAAWRHGRLSEIAVPKVLVGGEHEMRARATRALRRNL